MHIVRFYERVKFKFDKLVIGPCDLVLEEGTHRTLILHLWYLLMNEKVYIF